MALSHHTLVAWQRADDLFIRLHQLSLKAFPAIERFELGSQMRRAAYSVVANIVEGFARRHRRDRLNFLNISESSLAEVGYCVHAACRLGYIDEQMKEEIERQIKGVGAPLGGLIRSTRLITLAQIGVAFFAGAVTTWPARSF
jgi:four helix bundle protein